MKFRSIVWTAMDRSDIKSRSLGRNVLWATLLILAVLILFASVPYYLSALGKITYLEQIRLSIVNPDSRQADSSEYWLDLASMVVQLSASAGCIGMAILIFYQRRADPMALLVSLFLLVFGTVMVGPLQTISEGSLIGLSVVARGEAVLFAGWAVLFYLFPDGLFYPPWTRLAAPALIPWMIITLLFRDFFSPLTTPQSGQIPLLFAWYMIWPVSMLVAQVVRYKRHSAPTERQQTKWVILGFLVFFGALFALLPIVLIQIVFRSGEVGSTGMALFSRGYGLIWSILVSLVPFSMGLAVLRYRLWDIDLILNRTLVYGILTTLVACVYILTVEVVSLLFNAGGSLLGSLFATGFVIVIFLPMRDRLQRAVNRLMYGDRDDPNAVFSRLGQRLKATLTPEAALPAILETVAQALKLPYAAITLRQGEESSLASEYGTATRNGQAEKGSEVFPLIYQNELMGELVVAPRSPGEALTQADKSLLGSIADQAGSVVYTVRLMKELQASRERLVLTREEERRRLRRDLHDGIGSILASLAFNLDAASNLLDRDPAATGALINELKSQTQAALADIRRLAYDLRPPILDELGFVASLQETIKGVNHSPNLCIELNTSEETQALPAAVEVAAYRITIEALNNVIRHAQAHHCVINVGMRGPNSLVVEIIDDGRGLPVGWHAGVGISGMRERASELGGSFEIKPNPELGTRVTVMLPLSKE